MADTPAVPQPVAPRLTLALARARDTLALARRDPRAAPETTRKNVTVTASCEFYGLADAISRCRVPRSCQDCLSTPGCALNGLGTCVSDTSVELRRQDDYLRLLAPSAPYGPAFNKSVQALGRDYDTSIFYASTAQYCDAADSVCSICRDTFDAADAALSPSHFPLSQFCVGAGGCVCIASCEVPRHRNAFAADRTCSNAVPPFLVPKKYNPMLPAFSSRRRDPRAAMPHSLVHRTAPESCEFYASDVDVRGCRKPRTCRDCLATQGCMLASTRCRTMDSYDVLLDYRTALVDNHTHVSIDPERYLFPSLNTSYCDATDPYCLSCRETFRDDWSITSLFGASIDRFCVGLQGCVCIESCEATQWAQAMTTAMCNTASQPMAGSMPTYLFSVAAAFVVWVALLLFHCVSRTGVAPIVEAAHHAAVTLLRHMLEQAPALRIDLFGWRQYYQELQVKEQQLLAGDENVSPVTHPIDFDFAEPSAPDFDDDESSAPTATDPRALASAPQFRATDDDRLTDNSANIPSAPDFDRDQTAWACHPPVPMDQQR